MSFKKIDGRGCASSVGGFYSKDLDDEQKVFLIIKLRLTHYQAQTDTSC